MDWKRDTDFEVALTERAVVHDLIILFMSCKMRRPHSVLNRI